MSYADGIGKLPPVSGTNAAKPVQPVPASTDQAPQAAPTASSANPADHADLSAASGLIATALAGSDVRTARVEALQQAIASGNYHISSGDIADKMIQSFLER